MKMSTLLLWLYDITRVLSSASIRLPSDQVVLAVRMGVEGIVRALQSLGSYRIPELLIDDGNMLVFEIIKTLFELCRQLDTPVFERPLLEVAFGLGCLEACLFLLDRLESRHAEWIVEASSGWEFKTIAQGRGREKLTLLQRLLQILPLEQTLQLARNVITRGQLEDLEVFLPLLDVSPFETPRWERLPVSFIVSFPYKTSFITQCFAENSPDMALAKTQVVLDEYCRHGARSAARSLGVDALVLAAAKGYKEVYNYIQSFLDIHPSDGNQHGLSGLHTASMCGDLQFCGQILDQHRHLVPMEAVDVCLSAFYTAFAALNLEFCDILESHLLKISSTKIDWRGILCSCSLKATKPSDQTTYLRWTVGGRLFCLLDCVLCSTMWQACRTHDHKLLAFCLDHGFDYRSRERRKVRNLCGRESLSLLDTVLHSECCSTGRRPLRPGVSGNPTACTQVILDHGLRLSGGEVLDALRLGNPELARVLMAADPGNLGALSARGVTLLEAAVCSGDRTCIEYVRQQKGCVFDSRALCAAVFITEEQAAVAMETISDLLEKRPHNQQADVFEMTAVGLAALKGNKALLTRLLEAIKSPLTKGIGPPITSHFKLRPSARFNEFSDTDPGFFNPRYYNISANRPFWTDVDRPQCSPMALGVLSKNVEITSVLLGTGLEPDDLSISIAAFTGHRQILSMLLRHQLHLGKWTIPLGVNARPPLVYAAENRDLETLTQLLSAGADVNDGGTPADEEWTTRTPLQVASADGNIAMVSFLLNRGAQVHAAAGEYRGATALQYAVMYGHVDVAVLLLEHGASTNEPAACHGGMTCLEGAMEGGFLNMLELLIDRKVAVDGPHRASYILAVARSLEHRLSTLAQHLKSYRGWDPVDEEACRIARLAMYDFPEDGGIERAKIAEEFGWDSCEEDSITGLEGRMQLQLRWEMAKKASDSCGVGHGDAAAELELMAAMRRLNSWSPEAFDPFNTASMSFPIEMDNWHVTNDASPMTPSYYLEDLGDFETAGLNSSRGQGMDPGVEEVEWESFLQLFNEPHPAMDMVEDFGEEGGGRSLALVLRERF
jgi:hypothetical protein